MLPMEKELSPTHVPYYYYGDDKGMVVDTTYVSK